MGASSERYYSSGQAEFRSIKIPDEEIARGARCYPALLLYNMGLQNSTLVSQQTPHSLEEQGGDFSLAISVEENTAPQKNEQGGSKTYTTEEDIRRVRNDNPRLMEWIDRSGARIDHVETVDVRLVPLSIEEALIKVANANTSREIGLHGAVMAAWTPEENRGEEALSLFNALFPRDAAITAGLVTRAMQYKLLSFPELKSSLEFQSYQQLMIATLDDCMRFQGTKYDPWSEEEPGKIAHEVRDPTSLRAKQIQEENKWKFPYYGNTDNTGRFVKDMVAYIAVDPEKRKAETVERIVLENGVEKKQLVTREQALFEAAAYLKRHMPIYQTDVGHSENPEGLIEFKSAHPEGMGIRNQGWRDSGEGYLDKKGRMPNYEKGIADFATNVEAYDALKIFTHLYPDRKDEMQPYLDNLKKQISEKFWVEDEKGGYFALATDRDENGKIRQLDALTSNTGFILGSDLLKDYADKQRTIIERLFSPEMLNSAGIRTLGTDHPFFHPDGYQNGTVWPWYNAVIAEHLDALGYHGLATFLQQRILASNVNNMFFEYNRGDDAPTPSVYFTIVDVVTSDGYRFRAAQPPQPFQAWTIGAVINASEAVEVKKKGSMPFHAVDPQKQEFETALINSAIDSSAHQEYPIAA